ncbi:MAG: 8-oxo-dGTP diphosphatase [Verrucomicrobiota bacterium]
MTATGIPDKIPYVGIGCIVIRNGQLLLVRNQRGFWSTPGGHLDFGESPDVCAARETLEETGVSVTNVEFVAITNDVLADVGKHYVTVWMRGDADGVSTQIGDTAEIIELGWFSPHELPSPLHLYFQNLLEGRCWPRSPSNLPFTIHAKP